MATLLNTNAPKALQHSPPGSDGTKHFDLFAKLIVLDKDIRRAEVDGVVYFAISDVLAKVSDNARKTAIRQFWHDLKKSPRLRNMSLNFSHIHFGGRGRPVECGDYAAVLYIAMSLPDERANLLRVYVASRIASLSEPTFKYLMRQQSEGKALAAEEIRHLYLIGHFALPDPQTPAEEIGYSVSPTRSRKRKTPVESGRLRQ